MASKLLLTPEVSDRIRKPVATLRWLRHIGEGPPSFKIGRTVVYDEAELEKWIDEQRTKQSA